jgi:hypothetical protein
MSLRHKAEQMASTGGINGLTWDTWPCLRGPFRDQQLLPVWCDHVCLSLLVDWVERPELDDSVIRYCLHRDATTFAS